MALRAQAATEAPSQAEAVKSPVVTAPTPAPAKVKTAQYPHITGELRRIGIVAGIILAILVVLAIVLS